MERITTKPTEQKPYTIYAGSFDVEETDRGTCVNPVGVGYCDPEEDTIYLATAPEGFERQLHDTFVRKNGLFVPKTAPPDQSGETKLNFLKDYPLPPEAEPLHSSDGADVAGFNGMSYIRADVQLISALFHWRKTQILHQRSGSTMKQ